MAGRQKKGQAEMTDSKDHLMEVDLSLNKVSEEETSEDETSEEKVISQEETEEILGTMLSLTVMEASQDIKKFSGNLKRDDKSSRRSR